MIYTKRMLTILLILGLLMGLPQLHTAEAGTTVNLVLDNVTPGWGDPLQGVRDTLKDIRGVSAYHVRYDMDSTLFMATVTFNRKRVTIEDILAALKKEGHSALPKLD